MMTFPGDLNDRLDHEGKDLKFTQDFTMEALNGHKIDLLGDVRKNGAELVDELTAIDIAEDTVQDFSPEVSITWYGAVGNGSTDNTTAINNAIAAVGALGGGTVVIPPAVGVFNHGPITINYDNVTLMGKGGVLFETTASDAHIKASGKTGLKFINLNLDNTPGARSSGRIGIDLRGCTDCLIQGNTIKNPRGGGIYLGASGAVACSWIRVVSNKIFDSMADGIHMPNGANNISVIGNQVDSSGDDGISVVSYVAFGSKCHDIVIANNIVRDGSTRGITVLGGDRVLVTGNVIETPASAGILALRDTTYDTYGVVDITISNNILYTTGIAAPDLVPSISVGGSPTYPASGLKILNNNLNVCRYRGILVTSIGGVTAGTVDVEIIGNTIRTSGNSPIRAADGLYVVIRNNTMIDCENTQIGLDALVAATAYITIDGNVSVNPNPPAAASMRFVNAETATFAHLVITNNKVIGGTLQSMYRVPSTTTTAISGNTRTGVAADTFNGTEPATRHLDTFWHGLQFSSFVDFLEQGTEPASPGADIARIFTRNSTGNKTQICAKFSSGDVIVLATQDADGLPTTVTVYSGTAVTASLVDLSCYLRFSGTNPVYTIPENATVAFPIGTEIHGTSTNTTMSLAAAGVVVINKPRTLVTASVRSGWTIIKVNTDAWDLHGDFV